MVDVVNVIALVCVGAFVFCLVVGLIALVVPNWPRDPNVRTWLLRGVVFVAVGAVIGIVPKVLATVLESTGKEQVTAPAHNTLKLPATPSPGDSAKLAPTNTETSKPPIAKLPAVDPPPLGPPVPAVSQEVRDWATNNLGSPPETAESIEHAFPACVQTVPRESDAAARKLAAKDCEAALLNFRRAHISPYFKAKAAYDTKLDKQERLLRSPGNVEKYDFVDYEKRRLNRPETGELVRINKIDERSSAALLRCRQSECRVEALP
jgi:hypothetical protein